MGTVEARRTLEKVTKRVSFTFLNKDAGVSSFHCLSFFASICVCPRDALLSHVPVRSWQEAIWSAVLDEIQQDAEADIDMANSEL